MFTVSVIILQCNSGLNGKASCSQKSHSKHMANNNWPVSLETQYIVFLLYLILFSSLNSKHMILTIHINIHVYNQEVWSRTGTRGTFEMWEGTIQVAAVDAKHQSFICFEATSNQFHPSRFQANHVTEGRQCAKSVWIEEPRQTNRQTDMEANRHPVTQTDKQIDRQTSQTCTEPDMEEVDLK